MWTIEFKGLLMNHALITAAQLAALCSPAWAINKCTGPDGRVTFQDAPCTGSNAQPQDRKVVPVPIFRPKTPRPPMGDEEYERQRAEVRSREIDAYAKSQGAALAASIAADTAKCGSGTRDPHIGASAAWVTSCSTWGEPMTKNSTTTARGETQQWVYRNNRYLYFNAAQAVTAIQQ